MRHLERGDANGLDLSGRALREAGERVIERARARGELRGPHDPMRLIEVVSAPIWLRATLGDGGLSEPELDELVELAVELAEQPRRPAA